MCSGTLSFVCRSGGLQGRARSISLIPTTFIPIKNQPKPMETHSKTMPKGPLAMKVSCRPVSCYSTNEKLRRFGWVRQLCSGWSHCSGWSSWSGLWGWSPWFASGCLDGHCFHIESIQIVSCRTHAELDIASIRNDSIPTSHRCTFIRISSATTSHGFTSMPYQIGAYRLRTDILLVSHRILTHIAFIRIDPLRRASIGIEPIPFRT